MGKMLTTTMDKNLGQIRTDKAKAKIAILNKSTSRKWEVDYSPLMYVSDETDQDIQNPCELETGHCWIVTK